MSKETKDESSGVNWTYGGGEDEWDAFDRRMVRYMRGKLDTFGERLWKGEVDDITKLAKPEFANYVMMIYESLRIAQPKLAKELKRKGSDFYLKSWHTQWLRRQCDLMLDHIEDHAKGQAVMEIVNYNGDKKQVRLHLYKQFGAGSGGDIHSQEIDYEKGMPDKQGLTFKVGMDITVKLRQLEGRRLYFWKMCEPAKRKQYVFCQETKLVRIVLEHINDDYKPCVERLLDYVKVTKLVKASGSKKTKLAPSSSSDLDRSFNDDWLPSWQNLQQSLTDEYRKFVKDGKFSGGKSSKASDKLPVAFGGVVDLTCYACGVKGHKSGDPTCRAGPYDVADVAPKEYRERKEAKKRKASNGGSQQGNGNLKKVKETGGKKPCFDFAKGSCRRGASCRFEHEEGGAQKKAGNGGAGKMFTAKQKKVINVMLSAAVKKNLVAIAKKGTKKKKTEDVEDDDSDFAAIMAPYLAKVLLAPCSNLLPRNPIVNQKKNVVMAAKLHDVDNTCGVDSDAGMSISTLRADFIWLDSSPKTVNSLSAPAGINGGTSVIGGIGPMMVRASTGEFLIDPYGVYLKGSDEQPNFRVLATQRLKAIGVRIVQCFKGTEDDVLQDRTSKHIIKLDDEGPPDKSILVLKTVKIDPMPVTYLLKQLVQDIRKGNKTAMVTNLSDAELSYVRIPIVSDEAASALMNPVNNKVNVMLFNAAKCSIEERSRLFVRRLGYCDSNALVRMYKDPDFGELPEFCRLNEDNPVKDAAKYRKLTHERTDPAYSQRFKC